jgi:DNA-binding GntR family transcriptional regulator
VNGAVVDRHEGRGSGRVDRRTLAAQVQERLRDGILAGRWPAGMRLRQDALAAELGVSRIPLREAMAQLEAEGLIVSVPRRGAQVAMLRAADVLELSELRSAIEPLLIARSIPALTPAQLASAERAARAFDRALAAGDRAAWGRCNWAFHAALYAAADRPRALRLAAELARNAERALRTQLGLDGAMQRASSEHLALLQLARAGRSDEAARLLRRHILQAGEALARHLETESGRDPTGTVTQPAAPVPSGPARATGRRSA